MENIADLLRLAKERTLRKIIKGQKGQALPIVLILLVVGGLLIIPTLNYASTSLKGHQVTETKTMELYAADSGVEDAIYWLQHWLVENWAQTDGEEGVAWTWNDVKQCWERHPPLEVNDKTVDVDVEKIGSQTYKITSIAGSTILAYVTNITVHYTSDPNLSHGDVIGGNVYVEGNVTLNADAEITGNVIAEGDVILNADAVIGGNVIAEGDVILNADAVIGGDVCAGGNLELNARTVIEGSVYVVGNVELHNFAVIQGDVHAWGNVLVDGPNTQIVGGVYICPPATVSGSGSTGPVNRDCEVQGCPLSMGGTTIITWEIT